jgi:hypothetical protein
MMSSFSGEEGAATSEGTWCRELSLAWDSTRGPCVESRKGQGRTMETGKKEVQWKPRSSFNHSSIPKLFEPINAFSKVAEYKMNTE